MRPLGLMDSGRTRFPSDAAQLADCLAHIHAVVYVVGLIAKTGRCVRRAYAIAFHVHHRLVENDIS